MFCVQNQIPPLCVYRICKTKLKCCKLCIWSIIHHNASNFFCLKDKKWIQQVNKNSHLPKTEHHKEYRASWFFKILCYQKFLVFCVVLSLFQSLNSEFCLFPWIGIILKPHAQPAWVGLIKLPSGTCMVKEPESQEEIVDHFT